MILSSEIDGLIADLCRQKPELSREQVEAQIKAKISAIGPGYLTESGAVFLVASDYGIEITKPIKVGVSIKDLFAGAREVSLEARVLSISAARQFSRKDGTQFYLRTITIYDAIDSTAGVKLWDEKANLPGIADLKPGDAVKIIKAYVKEDRDGSLAIHVGSNSSIEPADTIQREIPEVESIIKDVGEINEVGTNLAVSGILEGDIMLMEYTRANGELATALKARLLGSNREIKKVVLWGRDMSSVPSKIPNSPNVKLFGVAAKEGMNQQEIEIHGNESTHVDIEGASDDGMIDPIIIRILTKPPIMEGGKQMVLAVDGNRNLYNITDTSGVMAPYKEGEVVECMPAQVHGSAVTLDASSYVRDGNAEGGHSAVPTLREMRTKVQNIKPDEYCCIECVILKEPEKREIQMKTGESVQLSETYVGDDTANVTINGWRNQAGLFDEYKRGDKVMIAGLNAKQNAEFTLNLTLTVYSKVTRIGA